MNSYLQELVRSTGAAWNRFWFTPRSVATVCLLRILVGLAAIYYLLSFAFDLTTWFGSDGLLPTSVVRTLTNRFHPSYLSLTETPALLWSLHLVGLLIVTAFTLGLWTRVMAILSATVVLSYIHRAPMIAGQFESVLAFLLLYLCLAPCGRRYSLDCWLLRRRGKALDTTPVVSATVSTRLIQVHLASFYLMMALSKLAGETWWTGDAVWWLIARSESRLVDLTALHQSEFLLNGWTHFIVVFELAFASLVWLRLARPVLLAVSVFMWASLACITGMLSFSAIMIVANAAFVAPETVATIVTSRVPPHRTAAASGCE